MVSHRYRLYGPGSNHDPVEIDLPADGTEPGVWLAQFADQIRRQQVVELVGHTGGELIVNMAQVWAVEYRPPP